jgi:hypothetical protein
LFKINKSHRKPTTLQRVIEIRSENLNGDRTHKNKLLFYLTFFRKIFLNPDTIFIRLIVNSGKLRPARDWDSR